MSAIEHARYVLVCPQCRATGGTEWWETDGRAHVRHPAWGLAVSHTLERLPGPDFSGRDRGAGRKNFPHRHERPRRLTHTFVRSVIDGEQQGDLGG